MAKRWLKRLLCRHRRWHKDPIPGALSIGNSRFVCLTCGKRKFFDPIDQPINYPVESAS
jgi:hypothetical protein